MSKFLLYRSNELWGLIHCREVESIGVCVLTSIDYSTLPNIATLGNISPKPAVVVRLENSHADEINKFVSHSVPPHFEHLTMKKNKCLQLTVYITEYESYTS